MKFLRFLFKQLAKKVCSVSFVSQYKCLYHVSNWGWGWRRKTCLGHPVIYYWPFQGVTSVCGSCLLDYIYQRCMLHDSMTIWWLFSCSQCPLYFICLVQANTVTSLLRQLLILLSVILVQCLVYLLNIFMLIFYTVLFYLKRVTSDIEGEVGGWRRETSLSPQVIHYWPFQGGGGGGGSDVVLCCLFLVSEFLVMFHLMFVHYTFCSVWVAKWPPFGK